MRTDFDNVDEGQIILVYPNPENPLKKKPHPVTRFGPYFYGDNPVEGPDYYLGDIFRYNEGFEVLR